VIFTVAVLVIVIDQLSKYILSGILSEDKSIPLIKNIFHLTLVHNTGIAFGMFRGSANIILWVTVLGLGVIAWHLRKDFSQRKGRGIVLPVSEKVAVGLIFGGAVGNLIDRLSCGYVIDFLDFRVWPVFNVADSCITIGAVILIVKVFFPSVPQQ